MLTSLDRVVLDSSLKGLFTRGILSRKKEPNSNSLNHPMPFRYRITELGEKIKVEQSKPKYKAKHSSFLDD